MKHEVIRTIGDWRRLQQDWQELLPQCRADSIFLTWEWLDTWLRLRNTDSGLRVICIRSENDELLGVAAHYVTDYRFLRFLRYRVLRPLGDTDSGAEYQTWLARADVEREVLREIVNCLREIRSEWDLVWMPNLDGWSGSNDPILDAIRDGGLWMNSRPASFASLRLPDQYDDFLKSLSSNRRQQLRRMSRRILEQPGVAIRKVESEQELPETLEALFELHGKRWRAAGEEGVFAQKPRERSFYEAFAAEALKRSWLAIYVLSEDGDPKAVQLGYVYNKAFLQLQEGFDPEYSPHVGNVLRAHAIDDCIRNGIEEYDFLGGVSEHKRRWLAEERQGMDLLIAHDGLKNLPIRKGAVWPTGAYLRPSTRSDSLF